MKKTFYFSIILVLLLGVFNNKPVVQQIMELCYEQAGKKVGVSNNISDSEKEKSFEDEQWYKNLNSSYHKIYSNLLDNYKIIKTTKIGTIYNIITWKSIEEIVKGLEEKLKFEINADDKKQINVSMVLIKGGTFKMGSDQNKDEKPIHTVMISDFYIGKYEVTNEEFCDFLNDYGSDKVKNGKYSGETMIEDKKNGSYPWGVYKTENTWFPIKGKSKHPVIFVTWFGAREYCKWAGGRLPTEAEWEYVAGNGSTHQEWAGTSSVKRLKKHCWYSNNSGAKTHAVGLKSPNGFGIYDMSGNVWEWCADWYGDYSSSYQNDPTGVSNGSARILRGGSWNGSIKYSRSAYRGSIKASGSYNIIGFRMVRNK